MSTFRFILGWAFGLFFILSGVLVATESLVSALPLAVVSLMLLPPVTTRIFSITKIKLSPTQKTAAILILLIVFGALFSSAQEENERLRKKRAVRQKQEATIAEFKSGRPQILAQIQHHIDSGEFQSAINLAKKYAIAKDAELKKLKALAKLRLKEKQNTARTEQLLAELKTIPASQVVANASRYKELAAMHPENQTYKDKFAHYQKKVDEAMAAQRAKEQRHQQIQDQFSGWDGSHRNLERFIKKAMHDPDSYDHEKTVYWDNGDYLIVQTTFRGKNAFGALRLNTIKAKVSLNGTVLQILE